MEHIQPASFGSGRPGPAPPPAVKPRRLTAAQSSVLDVLAAQLQPAGISRLASLTGLHSNTVREHLHALIEEQLVERTQASHPGRGRPSWKYRAVPAPRADQNTDLALALAAELSRQAPDAAESAIGAGRRWGMEQSQQATGHPAADGDPAGNEVTKVVENLRQLGFAPDLVDGASNDGIEIRLLRCPMLSAAKSQPEITCNVHLGLVQGWLADAGAGDEESEPDDGGRHEESEPDDGGRHEESEPDDEPDDGPGHQDDGPGDGARHSGLVPNMRAFAGSDYCLLTLRTGQSANSANSTTNARQPE